MSIPRGQQTRPSVKLPGIGSGVEVAIIGDRHVPWTEFGSNAPKMGRDGKPRKQLRVTGVVVSSSNANAGSDQAPRPPDIGEIVDLYLHGHVWGLWIDGEKAFKTAGNDPRVGDVMLWYYSHDEASPSGHPKKMRTVTFRRPRPDEQWALQQAEALYHQLGFDRPDTDPGLPDTADDGPFPATGTASGYPPQQPQYPPQQQPQYPQGGYGQSAPQPSPYQQGAGVAPGQAPQQPVPAQPSGGYAPQPQGPGF